MTRRALLAALAAPALPGVAPLDCVRYNPCAGDLIASTDTDAAVLVRSVDSRAVYITKRVGAHFRPLEIPRDQWSSISGWDSASVVRLGLRGDA